MTAPKVIRTNLHGTALVTDFGKWETDVSYIRPDAPELVAMIEALRFADETFRDLGWHSKWEVTSAALAAYEALTKGDTP